MAWASISKLTTANQSNSGAYIRGIVGYDPFGRPVYGWVWHPGGSSTTWQEVAKQRRHGCTRPQKADVSYVTSGAPLLGNIRAESHAILDFSGGRIWHGTDDYRLKPGNFRGVIIDSSKLNATNLLGNSSADISGLVELNDAGNTLHIQNLTGSLDIANASNYYSTYRVVVVKERQDMTKEEFVELSEGYQQFVFPNVVAEGSVTLTKDGVVATGILKDVFKGIDVKVEGEKQKASFVSLNNELEIDRGSLASNEELAVITYVDGGFNYALVAPDNVNGLSKKAAPVFIAEEIKGEVTILPNPAANSISLTVPSDIAKSGYMLSMVDNMGRQIMTARQHTEQLIKFDVSTLPNGVYFLNVITNGKVITQKVVISH